MLERVAEGRNRLAVDRINFSGGLSQTWSLQTEIDPGTLISDTGSRRRDAAEPYVEWRVYLNVIIMHIEILIRSILSFFGSEIALPIHNVS